MLLNTYIGESSSFFQKALNDGCLDLHMATVIFVGLENSLTLNAKHAVFQDLSGAAMTAAFPVNHEIYFNVNSTNKLLRRLESDDFDDIIVSSMSSRNEHQQVSSEVTPQKIDDPKQTSTSISKSTPLLQGVAQSQPTGPIEQPEPHTLNQPTMPQEATEIFDIDDDDEHELSLNEASNFQHFIQHLSRFKNEGKVELYHVFDFNSQHQMSEVYKIFIHNVSLCVMVTESSEHFHAEEINILQNNLSSSAQGLVIENCAQKGSIGNRDAKTSVLQQFSKFLVKNDNGDGRGYLFPMNCLNMENADRDSILSHAMSSLSFTTFPFSWYLFGFRLVQIMNKKHTARTSEAMKIASELKMNRATTEAALEHLMERNIIIYFRDILNDTIFLDVRIFSSIFSILCEKSNRLTGTITSSDFDYAARSTTKHVSCNDFSILFFKLMIMAPYNSGGGRYLIPSLLAPLNKTTIEDICQEYDLYPVYFKCPSLGYEFITMLIAFLLNLPGGNWKILKDNAGFPVCLHKNCLKFQYGKSTVLVSSLMGIIEVNMRSQDRSGRTFSNVSATILRALEKIRLILNTYHSFNFNMSFLCHCEKADHKHNATFNSETGLLKCECNKSVLTSPTSATTRWINISGNYCNHNKFQALYLLFFFPALGSLTVNNIMKFLDHLSNEWIKVANRLLLPSPIITSIQVSRLPSDQASLRKVIEWWFQNTPNPHWDTIQGVLHGNFIPT